MDNQQQNLNLIYYGSVIDPSVASTIVDLYKSGKSLMYLSQLYKYNIGTLRYFLIKNNIKIRNTKESMVSFIKTKEIKSDNILDENIIGWLMGDGGCRLFPKAQNPVFNYTDKHLEYILYVKDFLESYNIKSNITQNNVSKCYTLQTEALPYFKRFYEMFYGYKGLNENGQKRKILPDVVLTPIVLRNWYIGDGSSSKQSDSQNHRGTIVDKYKNDFILKQLNDICENVKCYRNGNCFSYHFNNESLKKLLAYIKNCPVECYKYKWITRCSTTIIETPTKVGDGIV